TAEAPKVPADEGGKFPLSTYLADRGRGSISDPHAWRPLPEQVRDWLAIQKWRSQVPGRRELLVETFPRANKNYLICYPFEGRLAHQTLGMLLTRRLERARLRPLGFVANEYALAVWGLGDIAARISKGELSLGGLFDEDMLGDDLEAWGALYWPEQRLLAVADLHLEKGSAFAARGVLLPPYDTTATLARLARLVALYRPALVVALGDSFHDGGGPARMPDVSRASLAALLRGRDWLWLAGNHDPDPPQGIGGGVAAELAIGPLTFRH